MVVLLKKFEGMVKGVGGTLPGERY